jgi:hypothetical protein
MKETCHFCGQRATRLCDHPVKGANGLYSVSDARTCDLPICDGCTTELGKNFDLSGPGVADTTDHCPFHSETKRPELRALK